MLNTSLLTAPSIWRLSYRLCVPATERNESSLFDCVWLRTAGRAEVGDASCDRGQGLDRGLADVGRGARLGGREHRVADDGDGLGHGGECHPEFRGRSSPSAMFTFSMRSSRNELSEAVTV